jgi:hypothetical protein
MQTMSVRYDASRLCLYIAEVLSALLCISTDRSKLFNQKHCLLVGHHDCGSRPGLHLLLSSSVSVG